MIELTANSQVYAGYVVSLSLAADARVELTDWNSYQSVSNVLGIATNSGGEGILIAIQTDGIYQNLTWNLQRGYPVFAFSMGTITQDILPKNSIQVGKAISSNQILIRISEFIMVSQ